MGASHKAIARIDAAIRKCIELGRRDVIDGYLDIRYDFTERATEWDADFWGFDPTRWMAKERMELARTSNAPIPGPTRTLRRVDG